MLEHDVFRAAKHLTYVKRSSDAKTVTIESSWTSELGLQSGVHVANHIITFFRQKNKFNQQKQNIDTFMRPTIVNAHCITRSAKYPDTPINCDYVVDKNSQSCEVILSCFRHLANG